MKQNIKVLIVESEPWLGEHFERSLQKHGFHVVLTSNAYSAMDIIDETRPDVIVMGLLLSGAGGLSLLHELQSYVDTANVPIIVCSGATHTVQLEELRPYGVQQVLDTGTMRPDDLSAAIKSVFAQNADAEDT